MSQLSTIKTNDMKPLVWFGERTRRVWRWLPRANEEQGLPRSFLLHAGPRRAAATGRASESASLRRFYFKTLFKNKFPPSSNTFARFCLAHHTQQAQSASLHLPLPSPAGLRASEDPFTRWVLA